MRHKRCIDAEPVEHAETIRLARAAKQEVMLNPAFAHAVRSSLTAMIYGSAIGVQPMAADAMGLPLCG
jgi:hypothetical protein